MHGWFVLQFVQHLHKLRRVCAERVRRRAFHNGCKHLASMACRQGWAYWEISISQICTERVAMVKVLCMAKNRSALPPILLAPRLAVVAPVAEGLEIIQHQSQIGSNSNRYPVVGM